MNFIKIYRKKEIELNQNKLDQDMLEKRNDSTIPIDTILQKCSFTLMKTAFLSLI